MRRLGVEAAPHCLLLRVPSAAAPEWFAVVLDAGIAREKLVAPNQEGDRMICTLTARRLKPGAYDDFRAAWVGATKSDQTSHRSGTRST